MLLKVNNLNIDFTSGGRISNAVKDVNLQIHSGRTLGLVGESGSGKSVTGLAIMRLLSGAQTSGEIFFSPRKDTGPASKPVDLLSMAEPAMQRIRGRQIAMVFQEPMTSLNPVFRCGHQLTEAIRLYRNISDSEARLHALTLLERVKLPESKRIFNAFPHELSGGQKQRVVIAMAMSGEPDLLIADEPTTALDVTVQKSILELMREWQETAGLSLLFISHDLGVIAEIADEVAVMQSGAIVESGPVAKILNASQHPYTQGLVACRPSLKQKFHRLPTIADFVQNRQFQARVISAEETKSRHSGLYNQTPLLAVQNLSYQYASTKNWFGRTSRPLQVVDKLNFEVYPGEIFGLAGESGCGKTTLGRIITRFLPAQEGAILYRGLAINTFSEKDFQPLRREIQMVFQDPYASLNPRMTIGEALLEPMQAHRLYANVRQRREKMAELLETVGLEPSHVARYPREFSGGQRQRICLARALALQPKLLVCDEIVSALDVSVQATILNLLFDLREKFGLTYLFISHDLSIMKQMCDRLLIMNQGKAEEIGFPDTLYAESGSPYVRNLIAAIPGQ